MLKNGTISIFIRNEHRAYRRFVKDFFQDRVLSTNLGFPSFLPKMMTKKVSLTNYIKQTKGTIQK